MGRISVSAVVVVSLLVIPLPGYARGSGGHCDFNGDGYDDAAITVANEDVGALEDAGAVNVIYGSADRLTSTGNQLWTQDSAGVAGVSEADDAFGSFVECGDFDDDGFDDLVVSSIGETVNGLVGAGAIHVLFGSSSGLTAAGSQFLYRDAAGVAGKGARGDVFGRSLAVGDFDGDGHDDLAVGVPNDDVGGVEDAGSVHLFYGFAGGLSTSNDQILHRNKPGIRGAATMDAEFGRSVVAADFDGDGFDDLAASAPSDKVAGKMYAGSVSVLYGSGTGLSPVGDQRLHRNSNGILGQASADDSFGRALAAGDFDGDGFDDLAAGVPGDDPGGVSDAGSVHVIAGSADGLNGVGDMIIHRNKAGFKRSAEPDQRFGWSLATGRFDAGNKYDLAVGVYRDTPGGLTSTGSVHVIYGSKTGLTPLGDQIWHQGSAGILDSNDLFDSFGYLVASGDFNGNGKDDLLVSVPHEKVGTAVYAGRVAVIYGRGKDGLNKAGDQTWTQDSPGIAGVAEQNDQMGSDGYS